MRGGDWAAAWAVSDAVLAARPRDRQAPRHLQPVWDGSPVAGRRVLVRCYHGLGDTIKFARFIPLLRARGAAAIMVWAQPALIPVLASLPGIGRLLPLEDGAPPPGWDLDVEVMELPHLLRATPARLPGRRGYLRAPGGRRRRRGGGAALRVGLVWRAGDWDARRSIPAARLRGLRAIPGVSLRILQRGPGLAEHAPGFGRPAGAPDLPGLARAIAGLDLLVSVESMPAHLAGALGVPVWTLLAEPADWRWMARRADTPWYASMRLFRQPRPGGWAPVVTAVARALRRLAARRRAACGRPGGRG